MTPPTPPCALGANLLLLLLTLLAGLLATPHPAHGYASMQLCSGYGSWIRGAAYAQMQIPTYSPTTNKCNFAITPLGPSTNASQYHAGQRFALTLSSPSSYGMKLVAVGGANFSAPSSGGALSNSNTCLDFDSKRRSISVTMQAPVQGVEIRVKAICGTNEVAMYVANDVVLQPGPDVLPPAALTSTDPAYAYMNSLGTGFNLFYSTNTTHIRVKVELQRAGYVSFGVGSAMVPSVAVIGMDPASNAGYNAVGVYKLLSKSGSNAQIAQLLAGPSQFSSYGITSAQFAYANGFSTLTFTMSRPNQNAQLTFVDASAAGIDCVYAAGSSAAFGMHSIAGTLSKLNMATGSSAGAGNPGAASGGSGSTVTPVPAAGGTSADPAYDWSIVINAQMTLYFKKNDTHLKVKLSMTANGYLSFGVGAAMVNSVVVTGMNPASNAGYPAVGVYKLLSKAGTNAQITSTLATAPSALYSAYGITDSSFTTAASLSELAFTVELAKQNAAMSFFTAGASINAVYAGGSDVYGMHQFAGVLGSLNFGAAGGGGSTVSSGGAGAGGGNSSVVDTSGTGSSSDPNYAYQIPLGSGGLTLFYKKNDTHLKIKLDMPAQGYLSVGPGSLMVNAVVVVGMNPATNGPAYPAVGVYHLNSKTGSNAQITSPLAVTPSDMYTKYGVTETAFLTTATSSSLAFTVELAKQPADFTLYSSSASAASAGVDVIFAGGADDYGMHLYQGVLGQLNFASSASGYHPSAFAVDMKLTGHIIAMLLAWNFLCDLGVVVALFGRRGVAFTRWYPMHWVFQALGVVAGFIGTGFGYFYVEGKLSTHWDSTHKLLGLAMLVMSIAQPLIGYFRPPKLTKAQRELASLPRRLLRPAFQSLHLLLGYALIVAGIANSLLGVDEMVSVVGAPGTPYLLLGATDVTGFGGFIGKVVLATTVLFLAWIFGGMAWLEIAGWCRARRGEKQVMDGGAAGLPTLSMEEVAKHNTEASCWVVYNGVVYDVTRFLAAHPGGRQRILNFAGQDITEAYEDVGHTNAALLTMSRLAVGRVGDFDPELSKLGHAVVAMSPGASPIAQREGAAALLPTSARRFLSGEAKRRYVELASKAFISHNVVRLRFKLLDVEPSTVLGLPIGKHVVLYAPAPIATRKGYWNGHKDSEASAKEIQRKYTPVSDPALPGHFDLVLKVYRPSDAFVDGGKMSVFLGDKLRAGDMIEIAGKGVGGHEYLGSDVFKGEGNLRVKARRVCMVAGGTGITPMVQIANALLKDPTSQCSVRLLYANSTTADVLMKPELDAWPGVNPARDVRVWYTVSRVANGEPWAYDVGRVDADMFKKHLADGVDAAAPDVLYVVCGPEGLVQSVRGHLERGLGVSPKMVWVM